MCVTVSVVSRQWDKVEDKYAVATIGVVAIVALWTAAGALKVQGVRSSYIACYLVRFDPRLSSPSLSAHSGHRQASSPSRYP
jgi:hypothetical protein